MASNNYKEMFERCPNFHDLRRLALMMSMDKSLFIFVTKELDDDSVVLGDTSGIAASIIDESNTGQVCGRVYGILPRPRPIGDVVHEITTLLRKVFKKKDTESLTTVFTTLMKYPKEDIVMGLIESLSKQSPEKQREILEHIVGSPQQWKNKVAIEVVKRSNEQKKNRDSYDYYV